MRWLTLALLAAMLTAAGCALRPAGEDELRRQAAEAGKPWTQAVELPALPAAPAVEDYLQYAFLNSAELRQRYWEWRSAIEQIPQDASFPNIALMFNVMFNRQNMSLWDRSTLALGNDPMSNIPFPSKVAFAGKTALQQARAVAADFEGAKFMLQRKVRWTFSDLALLAESIRIETENVALMETLLRSTAAAAATAVTRQGEVGEMRAALELARNSLENLRAEHPPLAARMNALLGREADAPVPLPASLPPLRETDISTAELIRLGAERNPGLAMLAWRVAGREDALVLARQGYLPDFGLSAGFTGSVSQTIGGMILLPARIEAISARIEQADADLRAAAAAREQYRLDLSARFVLNLVMLRSSERQISLFERTIIPELRQVSRFAQSGYASGGMEFTEVIKTERALLEARLTLARLAVEREKALAEIESLVAIDAAAMPGAIDLNSAAQSEDE